MKRLILIPLSIAAIFASGCSTPSEPKPPAAASESSTPLKTAVTTIEGSWNGREVTPDHEGPASLTFSGQKLEFHGANANDWAKGTFTLQEDATPKQLVGVVTESSSGDNVGLKTYAIYKIEDGTLTLSGGTNFPSAFDAPGCRQFVLKRN